MTLHFYRRGGAYCSDLIGIAQTVPAGHPSGDCPDCIERFKEESEDVRPDGTRRSVTDRRLQYLTMPNVQLREGIGYRPGGSYCPPLRR